jgi:hypothetical protein
LVEAYATAYSATILYFDFAGEPDGDVVPSDDVGLDDLGRMTLINADLNGKDAANLLSAVIAWRQSRREHDSKMPTPTSLMACTQP